MDLSISEFPYYSNNIGKDDIISIFEAFKKIRVPKRDEGIFHVNINFDKDEKFLRITDYFSEKIRIRCHFADSISVYDWYRKNKSRIIEEFGSSVPYKVIDNYIWSHTKPCSNFPTIIALQLLRKFKVKRWLDPSAGWGDRLVAAMAYGCEYHGVDPNKAMQSVYKDIINTLPCENKDKFTVTCTGFEDFKTTPGYYDLVFTSPPFFDLEKYSSDKTQSNVKFTTLVKWMEGFMYPYIIKSIMSLRKGGRFAIYVNDYKDVKYVQKIRSFINSQISMKWEGFISWQISKGKRKIMVWKKIQ